MSISLGIAKGSCLGPLFFLIFINDLPFLLEILTKLFADDTTLYLIGNDLHSVQREFEKKLSLLFEWCANNRLDINWKKTFVMFVTNKRVSIPSSILLNGISVEVVDSFKLLGVIIDNKLSFSKQTSSICKIVNCKLFSIKRLFYLSTDVKIQFFKSFILPYFDYCCSLFIYFPKVVIQKLSNLYYLCLYKLFKFNFSSDDASVANQFLKKYGLFSFQHRILIRFCTFSYKIYMNHDSPTELQKQIKSNVADLVNPQSTDTKELRNRKIFLGKISNLKYGEITFEKCFSRFVDKCILLKNIIEVEETFFNIITKNIDDFFVRFIHNFLEFDLIIKNFIY